MKLSPEVVEQLKSLLPPEFVHSAWIAGGYAHSPEKASDLDLWVVGQENMDLTEEVIRFHLIQKGVLAAGAPVNQRDAFRLNGDKLYNEHPHGFRVVANLTIEEKIDEYGMLLVPVQILVTRQPDIDSLLEHFDITTHKIAYPLAATSTFRVGKGYYPIGTQPRVMRFDTPEQTLQRLEKISSRYGFEPHPDDVAELERLAIASSVNREADFEEVPF